MNVYEKKTFDNLIFYKNKLDELLNNPEYNESWMITLSYCCRKIGALGNNIDMIRIFKTND